MNEFGLRMELTRKQIELSTAERKSQHSTRYTENPDFNRHKARELRTEVLELQNQLNNLKK